MASRDNPNDYFSWFNDDDRVAIVERKSNTTDSKGITSGEYDTYIDSTVTDGLKITIHSKYEQANNLTDDLQSDCGLNETMHSSVLDYVKSRVLEDNGELEKSRYFYSKYRDAIHKTPTRKSGVRVLLVPEL